MNGHLATAFSKYGTPNIIYALLERLEPPRTLYPQNLIPLEPYTEPPEPYTGATVFYKNNNQHKITAYSYYCQINSRSNN